MFDFEKLEVYKQAKTFNLQVQKFLLKTCLDNASRHQLRRASLSIVLNIAEGSGRNSKADKKNFFVIARGSTFECVAILDVLKDENIMGEEVFGQFYNMAEELSKMLYAMIQKLNNNSAA
jgi:four helix bundle protein